MGRLSKQRNENWTKIRETFVSGIPRKNNSFQGTREVSRRFELHRQSEAQNRVVIYSNQSVNQANDKYKTYSKSTIEESTSSSSLSLRTNLKTMRENVGHSWCSTIIISMEHSNNCPLSTAFVSLMFNASFFSFCDVIIGMFSGIRLRDREYSSSEIHRFCVQ